MTDQFTLFAPQTSPEIYTPGDIVSYQGLQHTVKEVRANSQVGLDNGKVVWPWEVIRIAKQLNAFEELGLPELVNTDSVQLLLM